jgi:hypothetical protein
MCCVVSAAHICFILSNSLLPCHDRQQVPATSRYESLGEYQIIATYNNINVNKLSHTLSYIPIFYILFSPILPQVLQNLLLADLLGDPCLHTPSRVWMKAQQIPLGKEGR